MFKTLLIAASSAAMIATPIAASAHPWGDNGGRVQRTDVRDYHGRGYDGGYDRRGYDRDGNGGAAIAAGLFGLFLTAAIASSHPYAEPAPYAVRCGWETQAYPGPYGQVTYQQVRVCR